jgi:hypothetical protein
MALHRLAMRAAPPATMRNGVRAHADRSLMIARSSSGWPMEMLNAIAPRLARAPAGVPAQPFGH